MRTFEQVFAELPGTGWLSEEEARLLWAAAQQEPGPILEVGCYHGRSTCLLAELGQPMYCVDPFKSFSTEDPTGEATRAAWARNLVDRGYLPFTIDPEDEHLLISPAAFCYLFAVPIEEWKPRRVSFAYLDGDHTYKGTENQVRCALACQARVIAVHDVNDSGGGVEVRDAAVGILGPWAARAGRLAVWSVR